MRRIFASLIKERESRDNRFVFLTGDLGFNALEEVRDLLGDRFVNMGVAEQNMISVAAGFAHEGFEVFCYSIAPFIVYRCLEQIRNDVCFHDVPVYLIGNGGGYGYGIMGSSHHAIEDIAVLSCLPNMHCYVPAFSSDVDACMKDLMARKKPAYLRLGLAKPACTAGNNADLFGKISAGNNLRLTIAVCGPVIHNLFDGIKEAGAHESVDVFKIMKLPYEGLSAEFSESIRTTGKLLVLDEHVRTGGLGERLAFDIMNARCTLKDFRSLHAQGYPDGEYGSQQFHFKQSGLDPANIAKTIAAMIAG